MTKKVFFWLTRTWRKTSPSELISARPWSYVTPTQKSLFQLHVLHYWAFPTQTKEMWGRMSYVMEKLSFDDGFQPFAPFSQMNFCYKICHFDLELHKTYQLGRGKCNSRKDAFEIFTVEFLPRLWCSSELLGLVSEVVPCPNPIYGESAFVLLMHRNKYAVPQEQFTKRNCMRQFQKSL